MSVSGALPATAGLGDPTAEFLEAQAAPGETTQRACLPNGFVEVRFFLAGALVSALESSTTCTPGSGGIEFLNEHFGGTSVEHYVAMVEYHLGQRVPAEVTRDALERRAQEIVARLRIILRRIEQIDADRDPDRPIDWPALLSPPSVPYEGAVTLMELGLSPTLNLLVPGLLNELSEINAALAEHDVPPVEPPSFFLTLSRFAPERPVARRSRAADSPWSDPVFGGALGYASAPAKAAPGGSGRLPHLRSDPRAPWSVWTSGAVTTFDRKGAASIDGHVANVAGGIDYRVNRKLIVGAMAGYEDQDFDTRFNAGRFRGRGPSVGPYASYRLSSNVIASAFAGIAFLDYDIVASGAAGGYDARRLFFSASLTGNWRHGLWRFSPRANVMAFSERRDGFTDSGGAVQPGGTVNVARVSAGPEVGYRHVAFGWLPLEYFGFASLDCDLTSRAGITAANGVVVTDSACGGRLGAGINVLRAPQGATGRFAVSYNSLGRSDQDSWTFEGRLTVPFH